MPFMDLALAQRLEATEGNVARSFVDARLVLEPTCGAAWRDFDGISALFDGAGSPMTQTFGLGVASAASPERLDEIEAFFAERGASTDHEVSPLAGIETTARLVDRGYRPIEQSTVLVRDLEAIAPPTSELRVRVMEPADRDAWIATSVGGWSEDPQIAAIIEQLAIVASHNPRALHFLVEQAGTPIATASLGMHEGVALFMGASTIPSARGQGAQALLVAARFAEARRRGCELAMIVTAPGSISQRNAERSGFRVAYSRTKWQRPI